MFASSTQEYSLMKEKLLQAVKDFHYRFERYEANYSIAIGYSPQDIDLTPLGGFVRKTDSFVILDQHTCAIILDCADDIKGMKAANNLLTHFQGSFFATPLYTCVVTASNYDTDAKMIHELFYLLRYATENNMNNILVESSQIIH